MKKRALFVLVMAAVLVFAFTAVATAKYAGYSATKTYLPWAEAQDIELALTETTSPSPHGGYTQTTVKCAVCHSTHRAFSDVAVADGVNVAMGTDFSLLNGGDASCAQCHAAWGASPSAALVEIGEIFSGPHIGTAGTSCSNRGCHGSVHGIGADTTYKIVAKYNLGDGNSDISLTDNLNEAIAAGNVNPQIGVDQDGPAMKAYATGYVCAPCHGNSSFSVAAKGAANLIDVGTRNDPKPVMASGHPSASAQFYGHAPTCEKCHDMVGVATNSTAWPHANRGIDVYQGRYALDVPDPFGDVANLVTSDVIETTNDADTRFTLWMTSSDYDDHANATPVVGANFTLQDGVCLKCHLTDGSAYSIP